MFTGRLHVMNGICKQGFIYSVLPVLYLENLASKVIYIYYNIFIIITPL